MANIFLAWNNQTDGGTLSGGSWLAALPLTNLQNRVIQKVARSTDTAIGSTQFQIDLGASTMIGVLGLIYQNMSVSAEVRLTAADSTAAFTNLLTSPRDFTNAAWAKTNVTVTSNALTAPDGSVTATKLTATASAVTTVLQSITATATTLTQTFFIKKGSSATAANAFALANISTATTLVLVRVNYDTGELTVVAGSSSQASIVSAGDGWWRLTLSASTGVTIGNIINTYAGFVGGSETAGQFLYVWGSFLANAPTVYDSNWNIVWPWGAVGQDLLDWETDNFWLGTLSAAQRKTLQSPYILRLANAQIARYWRVEISDTLDNTDGYVQIGRLFMARGWTPTINYSYGAALGYTDTTPVDVALSGAEYFDIRPKFRSWNLGFNYIGQTDAYQYILDMQRVAGISGEVLVMPDGGEDASLQPTISFVGRLRQMGSVKQDQPAAYNINFEIKELL